MSSPRNPNDKKNSSTKDVLKEFTSVSRNAPVIPLKEGASKVSSADLAKQYTQNRTPTNTQSRVTKSFDPDSPPPPMLSGKAVDKPKIDLMAGAPPTLSAHIKDRKSQNNTTNNDDEPGAPPSRSKP